MNDNDINITFRNNSRAVMSRKRSILDLVNEDQQQIMTNIDANNKEHVVQYSNQKDKLMHMDTDMASEIDEFLSENNNNTMTSVDNVCELMKSASIEQLKQAQSNDNYKNLNTSTTGSLTRETDTQQPLATSTQKDNSTTFTILEKDIEQEFKTPPPQQQQQHQKNNPNFINIVDLTQDDDEDVYLVNSNGDKQQAQGSRENKRLLLLKNYTEEQYKFVKSTILTPRNLSKCWICLRNYNLKDPYMDEVKEAIVCAHYVCYMCFKSNRHRPCGQCLSIFDQDSKRTAATAIIEDSAEALSSVEWLFDDIQTNRSEMYMKTEYFHWTILSRFLKEKFQLTSLKKTQLAAINAISLGKNVFVLMPSGGGKSLIYQLPACADKGVTVVISPILSLINDQVTTLVNNNKIPAVHLTSDNMQQVASQLFVEEPLIRLIYMTPEKFNAANTIRLLINMYENNLFKRIVFDEAHCITTWGKDFRFGYLVLKNLLQTCFPNTQIVLLTASVTPNERREIVQLLDLDQKLEYFLFSFNRPNLQYESEQINGIQAKNEKIAAICLSDRFVRSTGIIYCISHADCEKLTRYLVSRGVQAKAYHAGLSDHVRLQIQHEWTNSEHDKCRVMVATIAFGMGINKADVRFVLHYGLPKSLEGYYQESGRAGRDGRFAYCKLFWSQQDVKLWINTLKRSRAEKNNKTEEYPAKLGINDELHDAVLEKQIQALNDVENYAKSKTTCRRTLLLAYLGQKYDSKHCSKNLISICDNCLKNIV